RTRAGDAVPGPPPDAQGRLGGRIDPPAGRRPGRRTTALLPSDRARQADRNGRGRSPVAPGQPGAHPPTAIPWLIYPAEATKLRRRTARAVSRGGSSGYTRRASVATWVRDWSTRSTTVCARAGPQAHRAYPSGRAPSSTHSATPPRNGPTSFVVRCSTCGVQVRRSPRTPHHERRTSNGGEPWTCFGRTFATPSVCGAAGLDSPSWRS